MNNSVPDADVDMTFEIVVIPVSDVERAKEFYARLGWRLDADFESGPGYRVVQFTPPGSGCSVIFGKNVTTAPPGSAQGLHLIVSDIEAARDQLLRCGIRISEPFHDVGGIFHHARAKDLASGPNPQRKSYASYASFSDPDDNTWLLQEITTRFPGRIDRDATRARHAAERSEAEVIHASVSRERVERPQARAHAAMHR